MKMLRFIFPALFLFAFRFVLATSPVDRIVAKQMFFLPLFLYLFCMMSDFRQAYAHNGAFYFSRLFIDYWHDSD